MYPISCTSPRLLSICLAVLVLLAVNVVGSPIGSPVLALASPSVTLTSVHPLASNSPWNLHAVVTPTETVKDEIYFWMDGDNAELYIGSRRFGLSNGHERLEPKEVGIPQTGTRKIGQVIYPSTNVKEQVLQILGKCGIRITTSIKASPVRICRGHYFQNIIQKLVKVSEMNSLEVKDENGGGDLDSLFTNLLQGFWEPRRRLWRTHIVFVLINTLQCVMMDLLAPSAIFLVTTCNRAKVVKHCSDFGTPGFHPLLGGILQPQTTLGLRY